jgi:hypothetical protein
MGKLVEDDREDEPRIRRRVSGLPGSRSRARQQVRDEGPLVIGEPVLSVSLSCASWRKSAQWRLVPASRGARVGNGREGAYHFARLMPACPKAALRDVAAFSRIPTKRMGCGSVGGVVAFHVADDAVEASELPERQEGGGEGGAFELELRRLTGAAEALTQVRGPEAKLDRGAGGRKAALAGGGIHGFCEG